MPSQSFSSNGTWTAPSNISGAPQVQASGEGGDGAAGSDGSYSGAGGGGGEFAAENTLGGVSSGTVLTVTIGAGGTGTATTVTGGAVAVTANVGQAASTTTGGNGGSGSSNSVHFPGGTGGGGFSGASVYGAGGGSSAGTAAGGGAGGAGGSSSGGAGGTAPSGGAGGEGAGVGGAAGSAPGGGGGGGGNRFSTSGSGGTGAAGQVIITWSVATPPPPGANPAAQPGRTWKRRYQPWRRGVQAQAFPPPTVTISGSLAMAPMAMGGTVGLTPPPGAPSAALPGRSWRRQFQPARYGALPVQPSFPGPVFVSGSLAMAPMAMGGTMPPAAFQAIAPAAANPARTWKRRYQPWRKAVQEILQPPVIAVSGSLAMPPMAMGGSVVSANVFPSQPLGIKTELLLNGTWTDVTSYLLEVQPVKVTRGRSDETQGITAATCTLRVLNSDGRFSPSNTAGAYAPYMTRNVQLRVSVLAIPEQSGTPYSGYRFWGEISAFAPGWDESGNYRYVDLTAAGPIRRYSQGNATIGSALRRYYTKLTGSEEPYAYWPCEDTARRHGVRQLRRRGGRDGFHRQPGAAGHQRIRRLE